MLAGRGKRSMGNCTLFTLHFQQSTKLFGKIAKMNQSYWDMIGEISIFQSNWNMQKHSYAKSRKSIYFQTQTKIPFFHLRGFLIFNPTGLSFKQSFTIQTQAALSLSLVEAGVDGLRLFLSTKPSFKKLWYCQGYWGNNFIEWPNGSDSFMILCNM